MLNMLKSAAAAHQPYCTFVGQICTTQNFDTADKLGNCDFLYGTYILAIGGYLPCEHDL